MVKNPPANAEDIRDAGSIPETSHKGIFKDDRSSLCFDCGGSYTTV